MNKPAFFCIVAVVLFLFAIGVGTMSDPYETVPSVNAPNIAPNVMAGLASLGFSIAGGLALVAAAILSSRSDTFS